MRGFETPPGRSSEGLKVFERHGRRNLVHVHQFGADTGHLSVRAYVRDPDHVMAVDPTVEGVAV
jgi:predicted RNA methylase